MTNNRQNQHLLKDYKVEEVIMEVFELLRDSKDELHMNLKLEISRFLQAYCLGNGENQEILANHITKQMKMLKPGEQEMVNICLISPSSLLATHSVYLKYKLTCVITYVLPSIEI